MHNYKGLVIPEADVLIHAGDFTGNGTEQQVTDFAVWFGRQPHKHKLVVPGNHDRFVEKYPSECFVKFDQVGCQLVIDETVEIDRVKIFMSPWTPEFFQWAYMYRRERGHLIWNRIPEDTDVLVTHGPPYGILDRTDEGKDVGCVALQKRVAQVRPKAHIFGHIHESYGHGRFGDTKGSTLYVNASICTRKYKPTNKPIVIEI